LTLLEAWQVSHVNTAKYNYGGLIITVNCIRIDFVTVFIGDVERVYTPKQFGDFCRILDIKCDEGWTSA
jgi:hypothetical protein